MKQGGHLGVSAGFTIVEVLVVLGVSGIIFLSAVLLISGRQSRTEFMTASNSLLQQLQQVANETSSGYFPNASNFTCRAGIGTRPQLTNGGTAQGTNGDCIFLGKAVQFGATDAGENYLTYSIAGNRLQTGTANEVTTLNQAYPVAVAPGVANYADLNGVTVKSPLQNGLAPKTMTYDGDTPTAGFAFMSTLASYTDSHGSSCNGVCTGSQGLQLYAIKGTSLSSPPSSRAFADVLDGGNGGYTLNYVPVQTVTACFNSATTNQSAVYTIGGTTGDVQSVGMQINNGSCS